MGSSIYGQVSVSDIPSQYIAINCTGMTYSIDNYNFLELFMDILTMKNEDARIL